MLRVFPSLLLLAWLVPVLALAQATPARRIVSMNLCTDQLLLQLVARERIASLSYLAADPAYFSGAESVKGLHLNHAQAEEVMALQSDLILTSTFSATQAASVLQRLQQHVERLPFATSRREAELQIAQMGVWLHEEAKASAMIADMNFRIDASIAQVAPLLRGKKAVMLGSNGVAFGSGTLQDDFLQSVGLRNIAAEAGLRGPSRIPLEILVAAEPEFVISEPRGDLDRQQAHPLLLHPALARLKPVQLMLSDRWFDCAGTFANAYETLAQQVIAP